jgi:hypothetical protein
MNEGAWLGGPVGQQLTASLVAQACRRYQITELDARAIVLDILSRERKLEAAIAEGSSAQQIERTRLFQDLASASRKKIYYQLRRYDRQNPAAKSALATLEAMVPGETPGQDVLAALASGHVSTAERLPFLAAFHEVLFAGIGTPGSVLDLGCGVYPVLFPFDGPGASVSAYVAADKDLGSIRILDGYARARGDGRLAAVAFDIGDGWAVLRELTGQSRFDVAFLFKLVPVIRRQAGAAYQLLTTINADLVVLTGAARSMTKNQSIARRERAILLAFAEAAGLRVQAEAACGGECLVIASRRTASRRIASRRTVQPRTVQPRTASPRTALHRTASR